MCLVAQLSLIVGNTLDCRLPGSTNIYKWFSNHIVNGSFGRIDSFVCFNHEHIVVKDTIIHSAL